MTNSTDPKNEKPSTLRASADGQTLNATISLIILGARKPQVGDDLEISFPDGLVAHAAVVVFNEYNFPVIEFRGQRFTLVPSGRTANIGSTASTGTRWLVT